MSEGVQRKCLDLRGLHWIMGRGRLHLEPETDEFPPPETACMHAANLCRRPDGWMMPVPAPLSLHKHVRSTLLDDIIQTEIPLTGWNAEEACRKPPPKWDRQRAANRTAAGSSGPDKMHIIFTEANKTCDGCPDSEFCIYEMSLFRDENTWFSSEAPLLETC